MSVRALGLAAFALAALTLAAAPEAAAPDADVAATGAVNTVSKKLPRKQLEYQRWKEAAAVALAYRQPIIAFIGLKGDKTSAKLRTQIFTADLLKEFVQPNAVYYHYEVPSTADPKNRNAPPRPNTKEVKESEAAIVAAATDNFKGVPIVAVLAPDGKVLGKCLPYDEGTVLANFIRDLQTAFSMGGVATPAVSPKLQRLLDKELMAVERAKKANKGRH